MTMNPILNYQGWQLQGLWVYYGSEVSQIVSATALPSYVTIKKLKIGGSQKVNLKELTMMPFQEGSVVGYTSNVGWRTMKIKGYEYAKEHGDIYVNMEAENGMEVASPLGVCCLKFLLYETSRV
jgi:hypothetical protein